MFSEKTMKHYLELPVTAICIKLVVMFNVCCYYSDVSYSHTII